MKNCRLMITVKDEQVGIEGEDISLMELVELCGVLQVTAGTAALKRGMDMEDVKNNMLDVHLAAMCMLEERKEM